MVTLEYPQSEMQGPPFSVEESEVFDLYSPFYEVNKVYEKDILQTEENVRFKVHGLTSLIEKVFFINSTSLPRLGDRRERKSIYLKQCITGLNF